MLWFEYTVVPFWIVQDLAWVLKKFGSREKKTGILVEWGKVGGGVGGRKRR
jgi:hypothetical protein